MTNNNNYQYGEEATSQMHIAVYSEDEGMSVGDLKLCMGDSVIKLSLIHI